MELFRLQALQIYNEMPVPDWGPSIEGLDMSHIVTYVRPNTKMTAKWSDVPQDTRTPLSGSVSHRRSASRWQVSGRSMTRAGVSQCAGRSGSPGRGLHGYGERVKGRIRGYGAKPLYETGQTERSQICRTARSSLVRRIVCLCAAGRVGDDSAAVLFPAQCAGSRAV